MAWAALPRGLFQLPMLTSLDLSANELLELTEEIPENNHLHTLILDRNKLQRLPKNLKRWTRLRKLSGNNNQIKRLPAGLGNCQYLNDLQLENNRLTALPKTIGSLEKLETLSLAHNRLRQVPAELAHCRMLRKLNLANNRLKNLPRSLKKLAWLRELDMANNALRKCPQVIPECQRLRKLSLAGNKMKQWGTWPTDVAIEELDCSKNQLVSLPGLGNMQQLRVLDISSNKIQEFPTAFWRFPHLRRIHAQRNPAKVVNSDLLGCPKLETLQGLLSSAKKNQLLDFLSLSRQEVWMEKERALFFELFVSNKAVWQDLSFANAWRGAKVQDPYFAHAFRQLLYKRSPRRTQIRKGSTLLILGSLSEEGQSIYGSLDKLDISWTTDQSLAVRHVIFGTQHLPTELSARECPWYSEAQLLRQVDRLLGKPWSKAIPEDQLERVRTLLWNQQEVNCHLAIQLLRGSGVPKQILPDLLALYLRHPFPHLQEKLRILLFPYLPDLHRTLLTSGMQPPTHTQDVKTWKRWLGTTEIKAQVLMSLLQ